MYIDVLESFVPLVKQNYPNCRIVAVMSSAELDLPEGEAPWRDAILTRAEDLVDVLQFQNYGALGARPEPAGSYVGGLVDSQEMTRSVADQLSRFEQVTRSFIGLLESRNSKIRVGVAEWNWWMQASHWDGHDFEEPPLALHTLFAAGMIHRFASLAPVFEIAHFYNLVNCMGIVNHRGAEVEVTGVAEVFKLYRPAFPGTLRSVTVDAPALGEAKSVEALCVVNDDGTWLFIVNRDSVEAAEVAVKGFALDAAEIASLAGEHPTGHMRPATSVLDDGTLTVPPLSITRCRLMT